LRFRVTRKFGETEVGIGTLLGTTDEWIVYHTAGTGLRTLAAIIDIIASCFGMADGRVRAAEIVAAHMRVRGGEVALPIVVAWAVLSIDATDTSDGDRESDKEGGCAREDHG